MLLELRPVLLVAATAGCAGFAPLVASTKYPAPPQFAGLPHSRLVPREAGSLAVMMMAKPPHQSVGDLTEAIKRYLWKEPEQKPDPLVPDCNYTEFHLNDGKRAWVEECIVHANDIMDMDMVSTAPIIHPDAASVAAAAAADAAVFEESQRARRHPHRHPRRHTRPYDHMYDMHPRVRQRAFDEAREATIRQLRVECDSLRCELEEMHAEWAHERTLLCEENMDLHRRIEMLQYELFRQGQEGRQESPGDPKRDVIDVSASPTGGL